MSMLGISWAMGAYDDGLDDAFKGALEGFDRINGLISEQGDLFKKIKPKEFFNKMDDGAKSAVRTIGNLGKSFNSEFKSNIDSFGVDAGNIFGKIEGKAVDLFETFALHASVASDSVKKEFVDVGLSIAASVEDVVVGVRKSVDSVKNEFIDVGLSMAASIETAFVMVRKEFKDATKPIVDLGKKFKGVAKDIGAKAKDIGAKAKEMGDKVGGVFRKMGDGFNSFKDKAKGVFSRIGSAFDKIQKWVLQFNVASIANSLRTLSGETGNLSNEMESMAVSNAKAAKPIIATMNLTAAEMRKLTAEASGMAIGMNVSADSVANTLKAIKTAGDPAKGALDAMNMSTKDWQKVVETTGIEMQDYVAIFGDMVASWNMSSKQAGSVVDNMMAIGKQTGIGLAPLKSMKGMLNEIGVEFGKLPQNMTRSGDEIQALVESSAKLSGAFKQMGKTEDDAVAAGNATAKMFAQQAVAVENLYAVGGEGSLDDSPLFKFLSQLGIGVDQAREIINVGSRDAVKGTQMINEVFGKLGGSDSAAVQFALKELTSALGEGASGLEYLAMSGTAGKDALAKMNGVIIEGQGALKQFGKDAFSSGRTLQESYDLARQQFETTIRSIARSQVKGLAGMQIKAFKTAGEDIKELGSDKTWGPLVKAVSLFDQMGAGGLSLAFLDKNAGKDAVANAAKMGHKIKFMMDTIGKVGTEFAPIMEMVGMLGPLGPLAAGGGIAALFMMDEKARKSILGPFSDTFDRIKGMVMDLLDKIPWNKIFDGTKGAWRKFTGWIDKNADKIADAIGFVFEKTIPVITKVMSSALPKISKVLSKIDFKPIFRSLIDMIKTVLPQVWDAIGESFGSSGQIAVGFIGAIELGLLGSAKDAGKNFLTEVASGSIAGKAGLVGLAGLAGAAIGTAIYKAADYMITQWSKINRKFESMLGSAVGKDISDRLSKGLSAAKKGEFSSETIALGLKYEKKDISGAMKGLGKDKYSDLAKGWSDWQKKMGDESGLVIDFDELMSQMDRIQQLAPVQNTLIGFMKKMQTPGANIDVLNEQMIQYMAGLNKAYLGTGEGMKKFNEELAKQNEIRLLLQKESDLADESISQKKWETKTRFGAEWMDGPISSEKSGGFDVSSITGMVITEDELALANKAGASVADNLASGVVDTLNSDDIQKKMNEGVADGTAMVQANSPPAVGPLSGEGMENAAYRAAYATMEQFALGMYDSTDMVKTVVDQVLNDAVIATMDSYAAKVQEISEKKTFLENIAKAMVRDFGGTITTKVNVAGETEDVKASLEAALAIPGLAGVTTAIIQEGAKTRGVLGKMLVEMGRHTILLGGNAKSESTYRSALP